MPERTCLACGGSGVIREKAQRGCNVFLTEELIETVTVAAERRGINRSRLIQEVLAAKFRKRRRRKEPDGVEWVWQEGQKAHAAHYEVLGAPVPKRRLTPPRRKLIAAAIEAYDRETAAAAFRGIYRSKWHREHNQLTPESALKLENVERLAGLARKDVGKDREVSVERQEAHVLERNRTLALEVTARLESHRLAPVGLRDRITAAEDAKAIHAEMRAACRAAGHTGDWWHWQPAEGAGAPVVGSS